MKKVLLSFLVAATLFACTSKTTTAEKQIIGFDQSEEGNRVDLYPGDLAGVKIVEDFVKAHNERDTATIRSLAATENFKLYGSNGMLSEGSDNHLKAIAPWFINNNPKWKLNFCISNSYTNKDGKVQQWVTSGGVLTQTVEGKEVKLNQYYDVRIVNGKIQLMYIADRKPTAGE